jgi:hypothetical protein
VIVAHRSYYQSVRYADPFASAEWYAGSHWRNRTQLLARGAGGGYWTTVHPGGVTLPREDLTPSDIPNMMSEIVLFPAVQRLAHRSPVAVLIPDDISATAVPPFESRPDVIGRRYV